MTTPGKNFKASPAYFPTPNGTPDLTACRIFAIPASEEWLGALMGAVEVLTEEWRWYYWGAMTPAEAAAAWNTIIQNAYVQASEGCMITVPAPFWDVAADVGTELPADAQIWYGKAGSFEEDLQIWLFQGMIIATFGLAGIKPAIRFETVARKFFLDYKNDHLGSIVRFVIDTVEIFVGVDTGDGSVTRVPVVTNSSLDTHEIIIKADEGDGLSVIRKELSADELQDPNTRLKTDTDVVQRTTDGGVTWRDNPANDPRTGLGQQFPPRGGADPRCDAAANMQDKLKALVAQLEAGLSQLQLLNAFLAILFVFMPEIAIVLEAIEAIAIFLLSFSAEEITTSFTDDQWAKVFKALYCNISADGTCTPEQLTNVLSDIHTACNTVVFSVLNAIINGILGSQGIGNVGLTNAGASGDVVGDCSGLDCVWEYKWNFDLSSGGWASDPLDGSGWGSDYVAGVGWDNPSNTSAIKYLMPSNAHIIKATAHLSSSFTRAGTSNVGADGVFIHRCDDTACDVLDWHVTSGQNLVCFATARTIISFDIQGDGVRPALTGGTWIS